MSLEDNKNVYRRFIETVFNQGKLDNLDEFLTPDYEIRDAPPGTAHGAEGIKQIVTMFRAGFPDLFVTLEELVAENDKVVARAMTRGTHKGAIFGIEPTGRQIAMPGLTMVRIENGKLAESWVKNDVAALMGQLQGQPVGPR